MRINERVYEMIHDLRNPLNSISMNAELGNLIMDRQGDAKKVQAVFTIILRECKACSQKLDELKRIVEEREDDSAMP